MVEEVATVEDEGRSLHTCINTLVVEPCEAIPLGEHEDCVCACRCHIRIGLNVHEPIGAVFARHRDTYGLVTHPRIVDRELRLLSQQRAAYRNCRCVACVRRVFLVCKTQHCKLLA